MDILKTPEFQNIYQVDCFGEEFRGLFKNNLSDVKRYEKWLRRRLKILDSSGILATDGVSFEKIENNIYSIRYPESKHNPRVIYSFFIEHGSIILLTAFLEKNSTDYEFAKQRAKNRIQAIKGENEL